MVIDYRKNFDSVPHCRLVRKVAGYGIGERLTFVNINGHVMGIQRVLNSIDCVCLLSNNPTIDSRLKIEWCKEGYSRVYHTKL